MKDTAAACLSLTLEPVDLLLQLLDRPLGELGARLGLEKNSREEGTVRSIEKKAERRMKMKFWQRSNNAPK